MEIPTQKIYRLLEKYKVSYEEIKSRDLKKLTKIGLDLSKKSIRFCKLVEHAQRSIRKAQGEIIAERADLNIEDYFEFYYIPIFNIAIASSDLRFGKYTNLAEIIQGSNWTYNYIILLYLFDIYTEQPQNLLTSDVIRNLLVKFFLNESFILSTIVWEPKLIGNIQTLIDTAINVYQIKVVKVLDISIEGPDDSDYMFSFDKLKLVNVMDDKDIIICYRKQKFEDIIKNTYLSTSRSQLDLQINEFSNKCVNTLAKSLEQLEINIELAEKNLTKDKELLYQQSLRMINYKRKIKNLFKENKGGKL